MQFYTCIIRLILSYYTVLYIGIVLLTSYKLINSNNKIKQKRHAIFVIVIILTYPVKSITVETTYLEV